MSTQKTRFEGLFEPPPSQPIGEQAAKSEGHKAKNQQTPLPRVKTNIQLRQEYFKAMKQIALDRDKLIYEVLDEAVGEYLERYQQRKIKPENPNK